MLSTRIAEVADLLAEASHGCWFLQDFHGQNPIAARMLGLNGDRLATRRCAIAIHADGTVRKLEHAIEQGTLDAFPGESIVYDSYERYASGVARLVDGAATIACEYSPGGRNPYVSMLDAGTIDLLRRGGAEPIESGWLVQHFEARLTDHQVDLYERSVAITTQAFERVELHLRERLASGQTTDEQTVQQIILEHFEASNLDPDHPPIVAVGENGGQPHYETGTGGNTTIGPDQLLLVDLWGKLREPHAVFSDFTRMFFTGPQPPSEFVAAFATAAAARDAAIDLLRTPNRARAGHELDDLAREQINTADGGRYAGRFSHRLGHSITTELHGCGAHLDGFEIVESRKLVPGVLFSVEPGIYTDRFGIRTEVNVRIGANGQPVVYAGGPIQHAITCLGGIPQPSRRSSQA